jgi:hypothetical protein
MFVIEALKNLFVNINQIAKNHPPKNIFMVYVPRVIDVLLVEQ